jgi:hypothetical protein
MMGEGKDGRRLREPLARRGVAVLDLIPPPESSPTVGGGADFWLNWGYNDM